MQITINRLLTLTVKYLHKKANTFYFRRGIPSELRQYYGNRQHLLVSLKTSNEQIAISKLKTVAAKVEQEFNKLRSPASIRDQAEALLLQKGLEPRPLEYQKLEGEYTRYDEFYEWLRDDYESYDSEGNTQWDTLQPVDQTALDILHGKEIITLQHGKELVIKKATTHKKLLEIERYITYFIDNLPTIELKEIRVKHVQDAVDRLQETGRYKTATVKKYVNYASRAFQLACRLYEIERNNPFTEIEIHGLGSDETHRYTPTRNELNEVKAKVKEKLHLPSARLIGLLVDTGLRSAEVGGLRLDDIRLKGAIPYLNIEPTENRRVKTKSSKRVIPLVGFSLEAARLIVDSADSEQVYAFPNWNKDDVFNGNTCNQTVNKMLKGINPKITTHSFRHILTDRLKDSGATELELKNIQGWTDTSMIGVYGVSDGLQRLHAVMLRMIESELV